MFSCRYTIISILFIMNLTLSVIAVSSPIGFGSCNRQNKPQTHWSKIKSKFPQLFVFLGDSVYAKNNEVSGLDLAFKALFANPLYSSFRNSTDVVAVWDDHDYGVNDAGRRISNRAQRQKLFLDYMGTGESDKRYNQDGIYMSFDRKLGLAGGPTVKFILLDTRSHRDSHYVRSLGEIKLPFFPHLAAAIRSFLLIFGFTESYQGDMLGEEQWTWLANTLHESTADFHVLVSSVQVMSSNPAAESWGHFPQSKRKLFSVLQKYDPKGLFILSGDVHHGEISQYDLIRENGVKDRWVEVTSSGMTHTCADSRINRFLCPIVLKRFSAHRMPQLGTDTGNGNGNEDKERQLNVFLGKNFGLIDDQTHYAVRADCNTGENNNNNSSDCLAPSDGIYRVNISVNCIETGNAVLSCIVSSPVKDDARPKLETVVFPPTYTLPKHTANSILLGVFVTVVTTLVLVLYYFVMILVKSKARSSRNISQAPRPPIEKKPQKQEDTKKTT